MTHGLSHRSLLRAIVDWFRVGYPAGMPAHGYSAAAALLTRRLTDEECVLAAAALLALHRPTISETDIRVHITGYTQELPRDSDVHRVEIELRKLGQKIS